jgi:hypothetical protein
MTRGVTPLPLSAVKFPRHGFEQLLAQLLGLGVKNTMMP